MGEVFGAFDTQLHRRVALKLLKAGQGAASDQAAARLLREARLAAALDHPGLVRVFDVGELGGVPFLAMEFVEGRPLRDFIGDPSVPVAERIGWLLDVARALVVAHQAGLIHRDIKPDNVMRRRDGVIKVLDFGVARRAEAADALGAAQAPGQDPPDALPSLTMRGAVVGTPLYMAPEQIRGEPLDGRCDQFSWGVMAFELLAGRLPWGSSHDIVAVLAAVLGEEPPPLRQLNAEVPPPMEAAVQRALCKPREQRFASMEALLASLGEAEPAARSGDPSWPSGREGAPRERPPDEVALGNLSTLDAIPTLAAPAAGEPPAGPTQGAAGPTPREATPDATPAAAPDAGGRRRGLAFAALLALLALLGARSLVGRPTSAAAGAAAPSASAAPSGAGVLDLPRPRFASVEAEQAYVKGLRAERDWDTTVADRSMREALRLDPQLAAAHLRLGIFDIVNRPAAARESFSQAHRLRDQLSPRDQAVLSALQPWVSQPSEPARAAERLNDLSARYPADAELLMLQGAAYLVLGREPEGLDALRRSLAVDPAFAYASVQAIFALQVRGHFDEATALARRCIEQSPSSPNCWFTLASITNDQGNRGLCREVSEGYRAAMPHDPLSAFLQLEVAASEGQSREVLREIAESWLALEPEATRTVRRAQVSASIEVLEGDFEPALAHLAELLDPTRSRPSGLWVQLDEVWLQLLQEAGRSDELARVTRRLKARQAVATDATTSVVALRLDPLPSLWSAEAFLGARPAEADIAGWERRWSERLHQHQGAVWMSGRARLALDAESARQALDALPAQGPAPSVLGYSGYLYVGRALALAGRPQEALPWLQRAAGACFVLRYPLEFVQAHYWLGRALGATGDRAKACLALAEATRRWGRAKPASQTAAEAQKYASSLGCPPAALPAANR